VTLCGIGLLAATMAGGLLPNMFAIAAMPFAGAVNGTVKPLLVCRPNGALVFTTGALVLSVLTTLTCLLVRAMLLPYKVSRYITANTLHHVARSLVNTHMQIKSLPRA
jgi:hypothetical protein